MAEKRGYGVGLQWFPDFIKRKAVYVDKTAYVYKMAQSNAKSFFLSRPRRFGKSLLVSTLQCYFEGRKELFKGLAIEKLEKEWIKHPVIRLDLSSGKYYELERLHGTISGILRDYEKLWGVTVYDEYNYDDRLKNIIKAAYEQTGQEVVILIDEYDAPMLDSITKPELQDKIRDRIRNLFSPLKAQAQYLRFVFLTGISKFSQLSVFSELNNLRILTFDPEYEGVCGITEDELFTQLKPDIEWLCQCMNRYKPMTYEDTVEELKRMYDGYHFSMAMTDVYNPWSLIYAFDKGFIDNYWFSKEQTSDGRMDISLKLSDAIYIIEFKYGKTADEAKEQILRKDYAVRFAADARPVYAVGLNISSDRRTIESYEIVKL